MQRENERSGDAIVLAVWRAGGSGNACARSENAQLASMYATPVRVAAECGTAALSSTGLNMFSILSLNYAGRA